MLTERESQALMDAVRRQMRPSTPSPEEQAQRCLLLKAVREGLAAHAAWAQQDRRCVQGLADMLLPVAEVLLTTSDEAVGEFKQRALQVAGSLSFEEQLRTAELVGWLQGGLALVGNTLKEAMLARSRGL